MHCASLSGFATLILPATLFALTLINSPSSIAQKNSVQRLLYVAVPGVRNYLEYGGHGLLVYDIDRGHQLIKRIPIGGLGKNGLPLNIKGIAANAATKRLYITTIETLMSIDLLTEKVLWEKSYDGGCDRMALSPDGTLIYLPSLEKDHWHVVDALTGDIIKRIEPKPGAHNTVYGLDGKFAYLAGLRSNHLSIADANMHSIVKNVGPFGASIRPFTINGAQTLCFVNINGLLGFEVGDLRTGQFLHRVEVQGYQKGDVKRHGCPSHGIGLTPDEKELWLTDSANQRLHIFDATQMPPKQITSIELHDQPGWITFSIDGSVAWPSTGEVIDTKTRKVVAMLKDERGFSVQSEKMVEVQFSNGQPVRTGDQFGIGRVR